MVGSVVVLVAVVVIVRHRAVLVTRVMDLERGPHHPCRRMGVPGAGRRHYYGRKAAWLLLAPVGSTSMMLSSISVTSSTWLTIRTW